MRKALEGEGVDLERVEERRKGREGGGDEAKAR